jgi:hypothetical protein
MMTEGRTPTGLPYSSLVVLFGDLFVKAGDGAWELSWRGTRVDAAALARTSLAAAMVGMARGGHIYLGTAVRRGLLRQDEVALVEVGPKPLPASWGGLEGALWQKLSEGEETRWADELVRDVIGGGIPYPDFVILAMITDHLTDQGYLIRERLGGFDLRVGGLALSKPSFELEPVDDLIQAAEEPARAAKSDLDAFTERNVLLWEKLQELL